MDNVATVADLRSHVADWRSQGLLIALVPTMGSLHAGHISLIEQAVACADRVVVSIFVNPTQFGPGEDLATYPRDEAGDTAKIAASGGHLIYMPQPDEMYPAGFQTQITVNEVARELCAHSRPHFFSGVATVVAKLLLQCLPDVAIFGEKDYQQLLVIRRMVRDLDIPVEIRGGPTVREPDGLALSSRNAYLSAQERQIAPTLKSALDVIATDFRSTPDPSGLVHRQRDRLTKAGFDVEYLEVRHGETLVLLEHPGPMPARVFAAARLGKTRLIDNVAVSGGQ